MKLDRLPVWAKKRLVNVVVEAPRDSRLKLKYEPELGAITWGHPLPIGFAYPYDWGFVPSTLAPDGDPLDALVLSELPSYPGVVVPCRPFGVMLLEESGAKRRERNDRLVVVPGDGRWTNELEDPDDLPRSTRQEIEHFFLSSVFFTRKNARCLGWKGPKAAVRLIESAAAKAGKRRNKAA
jgi:inorganic pyrophosphatase